MSFAGAANAQFPELRAAVVPGSTEAVVTNVVPGALVALVLGVQPATVALPGGAQLDVLPAVVGAFAVADAAGRAHLGVRFPIGAGAGASFFAQAVALDPQQPFGTAAALRTTPCRALRVPAIGEAIDIVVLFGQSNAAGYAPAAELPAAFGGAWPQLRTWNELDNGWQALTAGVNNQTLPGVPQVGPEFGLVEAFAGNTSPVWLVKFAAGSTSLGPTPGPWSEWGCDAGELYAELLRRVDRACADARRLGLTPRVRGLCMMQGESDAVDAELAGGYAARLRMLVQRLRADLQARDVAAGQVPFVLGLIDPLLTRAGFPFVDAVRVAQQQVAAELPDCAVVETAAFALQGDGVHFAVPGVLALGRAFAKELRARW